MEERGDKSVLGNPLSRLSFVLPKPRDDVPLGQKDTKGRDMIKRERRREGERGERERGERTPKNATVERRA